LRETYMKEDIIAIEYIKLVGWLCMLAAK
jgi:hypothetical protein